MSGWKEVRRGCCVGSTGDTGRDGGRLQLMFYCSAWNKTVRWGSRGTWSKLNISKRRIGDEGSIHLIQHEPGSRGERKSDVVGQSGRNMKKRIHTDMQKLKNMKM